MRNNRRSSWITLEDGTKVRRRCPDFKPGQRFGRLVFIKELPKTTSNQHSVRQFLWKCDCGNPKTVRGYGVQWGRTTSCGCYHLEVIKRPKLNKRAEPENRSRRILWNLVRQRAHKLNREFNLTLDEFHRLSVSNCHYCGQPPLMLHQHNDYRTNIFCDPVYPHNGIDRIDSSKGYTPDNSVSCCKICNRAKGAMTVEEFKNWSLRLHAHFISNDK